jgi:hypothetical protein
MAQVMNRPATYDDLVAAPEHLIAEIIDGRLLTRHQPSGLESMTMMGLGSNLERSYGCRNTGAALTVPLTSPPPTTAFPEAAPAAIRDLFRDVKTPDLRACALRPGTQRMQLPSTGGSRADDAKREYLFLWKPELHLGKDIIVPTMAAWTKSRIQRPMLDTWLGFPRPEWVAEIVAHSAPDYEFDTKLGIYAAAGIAHLWFIDPGEFRFDAYELVERIWLLRSRHRGTEFVQAAPFEAATFRVCDLLPSRYRPAANPET